MMSGWISLAAAAGLALATSACLSLGASTPPMAVSPAGELDAAEQSIAENAILGAAAGGAPRRWNSSRPGYYGYVEPGAASVGADGPCRDFAHTIFLDGRPKRETGRACRGAGGVWRIAPAAI